MLNRTNISKRKMVLLTIIFVVVLVSFRLLWIAKNSTPEHPHASFGVLDLRDWKFNERQTLNLDGQWEFYPSVFLSAEDTYKEDVSPSERSWIQVPAVWDNSTGTHSGYGYGTYRLRIYIKDTNALYGIRIPRVQTASRLYINGQLKQEIGHPTETLNGNKARDVPYAASFHTDTQKIDIVIHVSNHQYPNTGGIIRSIKFGTDTAVTNEKFFSEGMQLLVCVVLLLHAIYVFILLIFGYRRRELFYFAGIILFTLLSMTIDDDKLLLVWIPLNLVWANKLMVASYACMSLCIIQCVRYLVGSQEKERIFHYISIFVTCFVLVFLCLPDKLLGPASVWLYIIMLAAVLPVPFLVKKAIIEGEQEAICLFISAVAVSNYIIIGGFAKHLFEIDVPYYPFDLIIAFLGFASFWFIRFANTIVRSEKLTTQLQKADKLKDDFLANTSHELRNPLHGMINMAETVLEHGGNSLEELDKNNLNLMIKVGQRMKLLLDDLIDVTLLKERDIRLNKQSLNFQAVVSGVLDMLRYMAEGKRVEVLLEVPDTFPNIIADENRLIQILFNLLHNALKYTEEGIVTLSAEVRDETAYISIKDSGMGMDEETQHRIFQPYEQGDTSMTAICGGLGLGLSICKQLVELHGGSLKVESYPGQGSVFTFTLSVDNNLMAGQGHVDIAVVLAAVSKNTGVSPNTEDSNKVIIQTGTSPNGIKFRILAVDDDPVNLKILSNQLSSEDYAITGVTSGKDALTWLDKGEWDLIITDVMMPQMSGYELTQTIRQNFSISELPILLLTARSRPVDINTGFISGANDYLTKPVDGLELKSRVRALIDLKRSISEQLRLEAAWLQAQIQPHFLFNTLNSIASLSDTDTPRMVALLEEFGNFLRASFDMRNLQRVVPFEHELELLRSYLYIEKERFGDRLQIVWEVPETVSIELPPLTIQPLVENAVRHGILTRARGGTIIISVRNQMGYTEIVIHDDGIGICEDKLNMILVSEQGKRNGVGLINTDRRLKQIYGSGLQIISVPGEGTKVSFKIPSKLHDSDLS